MFININFNINSYSILCTNLFVSLIIVYFLFSLGLLTGFIWSIWTISNTSAGQSGLPAWVILCKIRCFVKAFFGVVFFVLNHLLGIKSNHIRKRSLTL